MAFVKNLFEAGNLDVDDSLPNVTSEESTETQIEIEEAEHSAPDIIKEGEKHEDALHELGVVLDNSQNMIHEHSENVENLDKMSDEEVAVKAEEFNTGIESIAGMLGGSVQKIFPLMNVSHGLNSVDVRFQYKAGVEGFKESMERTWGKIKIFISKIIGFFKRLINSAVLWFKNYKKKAEELKKKANELKGEFKSDAEVSPLAKIMVIGAIDYEMVFNLAKEITKSVNTFNTNLRFDKLKSIAEKSTQDMKFISSSEKLKDKTPDEISIKDFADEHHGGDMDKALDQCVRSVLNGIQMANVLAGLNATSKVEKVKEEVKGKINPSKTLRGVYIECIIAFHNEDITGKIERINILDKAEKYAKNLENANLTGISSTTKFRAYKGTTYDKVSGSDGDKTTSTLDVEIDSDKASADFKPTLENVKSTVIKVCDQIINNADKVSEMVKESFKAINAGLDFSGNVKGPDAGDVMKLYRTMASNSKEIVLQSSRSPEHFLKAGNELVSAFSSGSSENK